MHVVSWMGEKLCFGHSIMCFMCMYITHQEEQAFPFFALQDIVYFAVNTYMYHMDIYHNLR